MLQIGSKKEAVPTGYLCVDVTSHNQSSRILREGLSPFYLGPIPCYDGLIAKRMENVWQFSKVYPDQLDAEGNPSPQWFEWRNKGFRDERVHHCPKGKEARPVYAYWKVGDEYRKLNEIEARKIIFAPCYMKAVVQTEGFQKLKRILSHRENVILLDFSGYNFVERNHTVKQALESPIGFGHALFLYLLLTEQVSVMDGEIQDLQGILE